MKLSIIVTVYNLKDYISQCLDTLVSINLPLTEYEIIIVDDGSVDGSLEILQDYQDKFPQIRLYSQPNTGVGSARNLGISKANGTYLWMVDGDDMVISENVLNALEVALDTNADVLLFDYIPINEKGEEQKWISFKSKWGTTSHLTGPEYYKLNYRHSYLWLHFFKRSIFIENNLLFHPNIKMQDGEIMPKILIHSNNVVYFKRQLIKYRFRLDSAVHNRDEMARAQFYFSMVTVKIRLRDFMDTLNHDTIMYQALILKHNQLNQMLFTNLINNKYSEATNQSFVALLKEHKLIPLKTITGFTFLMNLKLNLIRILVNLNPYIGRKIYQKVFG